MSHKDILNNQYIINEYRKIDTVNKYAFSHGLQHVNNVCNIMEELTKVLKIDDEEKEALLVACVLHDVGQAGSRENHGLQAKAIAIKLFDEELKESFYYNEILEAIERHDKKCVKENSLFTVLVQVADTIDFSEKRLVDNYCGEYNIYPWKYIKTIKILKTKEKFGINISHDNVDNFTKLFFNERFTNKIINVINVLSEKLNLQPIIQLNGKDINFNNYVILHGSFGSKDGNWFPWLKEKLEEKGLKVELPQMPIGIGNQNYENWEKEFNKLLINENTTIIGHSIAPIFICKYLITNKIKVKKLIFVCGFNNCKVNEEYDTVNKPMFIDNYKDVKEYCDEIVCYYSDNDPYISFEKEKEFADNVATREYIIKNGGHINSETGYTKFEEILKEI